MQKQWWKFPPSMIGVKIPLLAIAVTIMVELHAVWYGMNTIREID